MIYHTALTYKTKNISRLHHFWHHFSHRRAVPSAPSGFGFELTFRLKREKSEQAPPTWPAEIMQSLARYVFQSENVLCVGDHISWHAPLDHGESYIQHMLLAQDPQLPKIETALGHVSFVQVSLCVSARLSVCLCVYDTPEEHQKLCSVCVLCHDNWQYSYLLMYR